MFKGTIVALVTPFAEDGSVDYGVLQELIEWQIAEGTDGIVLCGTTGEAPTLSDEEQIQMFQEGVATARGRVPIIAGTGSNNTRHAVHMTLSAQAVGVDGCLVVVPYYNRPTAEGCYAHYSQVAQVGLPIIVYHHTGRTGIKLSAAMLGKISALASVAAIKLSSGELDFILEVVRHSEKPVLSGDDLYTLSFMACGAVGVVSVVANLVPRAWQRFTQLLASGKHGEAKEIFDQHYPLLKALELETNPQCVKYAASLMGKCRAEMRLPLIPPQEATKQKIQDEMKMLMERDLLCLKNDCRKADLIEKN